MSAFEIPLSPEAQQFNISLGGVTYGVNLYWNANSSTWCIDLSDNSGNPIVRGIPLVANVNLLEQYAYLGIGGQLIVQSDDDPNAPPTSDNLGSISHLYFVTS